MKLALPLLALLICAACAPSPVAQAQTGAPTAQSDGAAVDLALVQARATEAVARSMQTAQAHTEAIQRAQAATAQANQDRAYALDATMQAQAAQQEAARLAMDQQQAAGTAQAARTMQALDVQSTNQALSITATAAAVQGTAQAAVAYAAATQSYSDAQQAAATAKAAILAASAEPAAMGERNLATSVALRIAPTQTAQMMTRQQARVDNLWSVLGTTCAGSLWLLAAVVAWQLARLFVVVRRGLEIRMAVPPSVAVLPAVPAPEIGRAEPPAQVAAPAGPETIMRRFVLDCARVESWDAAQIPGWRRFEEDGTPEWASPRPWGVVTGKLEVRGLIKHDGEGTTAPFVVVNGTLRTLYDAI